MSALQRTAGGEDSERTHGEERTQTWKSEKNLSFYTDWKTCALNHNGFFTFSLRLPNTGTQYNQVDTYVSQFQKPDISEQSLLPVKQNLDSQLGRLLNCQISKVGHNQNTDLRSTKTLRG